MGFLKCQECGRTIYSPNYEKVGLRCGVGGCNGLLALAGGVGVVYGQPGAKLDLQCKKCLHICSGAVTGKKIYDTCPIKGCGGILDRYWR